MPLPLLTEIFAEAISLKQLVFVMKQLRWNQMNPVTWPTWLPRK